MSGDAIVVTPTLRESILILGAKRTALREHAASLTTLALGSSHGDYGFDPAHCPGAFNLCSRSQDLKHSALLYDHAAARCPKLRQVVIFYSVFSPGFSIERSTQEREICPALKEIFGLDVAYGDPLLNTLHRGIAGRLAALDVREGFAGFMPTYFKGYFSESYGANRRAADHLKRSTRGGSDLYLVKMLLSARARGHRVLIVLPPVRSDYLAALGAGLRVWREQLDDIVRDPILGGPVPVLDLMGDPSLPDAWFGDYDHLLATGPGPGQLARRVAQRIDAVGAMAPADEAQADIR